MSKYAFKNLATAHYKIHKFLNTAKRTQSQRQFAKHLLCQIDKIETKISRWQNQNSLLSKYQESIKMFPHRETLPPTTKDFTKEAKTMRREMEAYIKSEIAPLVKEINDKANSHVLPVYQNYLKKVADDFAAIPLNLNRTSNWDPHTGKDAYILDYARILGATIKPYAQAIDPLLGESNGFCAGLACEWSHLVEAENKTINSANPSVTRTVSELQKNQQWGYFITGGSLKVRNAFEQLKMMIEIFNEVENKHSYYIHFSRHLIGYRQLPGSALIEIFEPNFGTIVFPNHFSAIEWLHELLHLEVYLTEFDWIVINQGPNQPADSQPSIPFNTLSANTLPFIQVYISKNLNEENIFQPWMQKALWKAFQNNLEGSQKANDLWIKIINRKLTSLSMRLSSSYNIKNPINLKYQMDNAYKERVIATLQNKISSQVNPTSFRDLIEKVKATPPYILLSTVIQDWLGNENALTHQTNADLLGSSVFDSLNECLNENEISHCHLIFKRINVLKCLLTELCFIMIPAEKAEYEFSSFFYKIKDLLLSVCQGGRSVEDLWQEVIEFTKEASVKNPLYRYNKLTDDTFIYQFAKDIASVDINNPQSLKFLKERSRSAYIDFQNHLTAIKENIKKTLREKVPLNGYTLDSFSSLYEEAKFKYINLTITFEEMHGIYELLPYSVLSKKVSSYTDSYLDLIKKIASKDICMMDNESTLFKPAVSQLYGMIQSATSLSEVGVLLEHSIINKKNKSVHMRAFRELINYLSLYEDANPRGYCLIDSFATKYGLTLNADLDDKCLYRQFFC